MRSSQPCPPSPLANAEDLPIAELIHADRNQQRDVTHLAGPAALEHDAVEINIGVLALDRPIALGFDRCVDLLVEVSLAPSCSLPANPENCYHARQFGVHSGIPISMC